MRESGRLRPSQVQRISAENHAPENATDKAFEMIRIELKTKPA
jgi:hypothetical protein